MSSLRDKVIQGHRPAADGHEPTRDVDPDVVEGVVLDFPPGGLTHLRETGSGAFREPLRLPPFSKLATDAHRQSDSEQYHSGQGNSCDAESERFRYVGKVAKTPSNMKYLARDFGKLHESKLSDSRERNLGISDWEMKQFIGNLRSWIVENATDKDGYAFGQREIAMMLGVKGPELSTWHTGPKRPGIARLLHLKERWGLAAVDVLIGYEVGVARDGEPPKSKGARGRGEIREMKERLDKAKRKDTSPKSRRAKTG